jgi:hypothetical protein
MRARGFFLVAALVALGVVAWHSYNSGAAVARASTDGPKGSGAVVVWKAGDQVLGRWKVANTNQCGRPVQNGSQFSFILAQYGQNCTRNQILPLDADGDLFRLVDGHTYTWTFETVVNLGYVPTLVWQIHPPNNGPQCSNIPATSLNSGPYGSGVAWSANVGGYGGDDYRLQYKGNGSVDTWKIQTLISNGSNASTTMWHNGTKWFTSTKPNYPPNCTDPWWNLGPYVPRWKDPSYHSPGNEVSMQFKYIELSAP